MPYQEDKKNAAAENKPAAAFFLSKLTLYA